MRDLELWRRIGDATAAELGVIASWRLLRRAPFLAGAMALTSQGDPAIRAAAVQVLAGVRGVPGVRAIVARLDDDDEHVRTAAVAALRTTAIDAPVRFAHALFHPRLDVRRAALASSLPGELGAIALRLRADPACTDLTAKLEWPEKQLALAIDLFGGGRANHVSAAELCKLFARTPVNEVRTLLHAERRRAPNIVEAVLAHGAPAAGSDILDDLVTAIDEARDERALDALITAVMSKKSHSLARRAAVSLVHRLGTTPTPNPALVGACAALHPRIVEKLPAQLASAAAAGFWSFQWPVKPATKQVEALLALPISRGDLALAAALAGLLASKRVPTLIKLFGHDEVLASLLASNHGWKIICTLPREKPALDVMLLQQLEARSPARYVELAGIAIATLRGERLDDFLTTVPRKYREQAFAVALLSHDEGDADRLASAIVPRLDRIGLAGLFAAVIERPALVRGLARAAESKPLVAAVRELAPAMVARIIAILDSGDPPPRDRELALSAALISHPEDSVRTWSKKVAMVNEPTILISGPAVSVRRALTADEQRTIVAAATRDLGKALAPALTAPVTGLVDPLSTRAPGPSVAACSALLGCADPLTEVAPQLDRFGATTDQFEAELDNDAFRWLRTPDVPPLASARLYRWEAHTFALTAWIDGKGGVLAALQEVDKLPGVLARTTLWRGISEAVMFWLYRDLRRFKRDGTTELALFAVSRIDSDVGRHAARIIVALVEGAAVAASVVRDSVLDRIADADAATREYVARIVQFDGVPERRTIDASSPALLAEIRGCRDEDRLARWCEDTRVAVVNEAALALSALGASGQRRLAAMLENLAALPAPVPILATVSVWDDPTALAAVRVLAADPDLLASWQFYLCLNLAWHGDRDAAQRALDAVRAPADWFFRREDWDALLQVVDPATCAFALADAPHHHAYQRAVPLLLAMTRHSPQAADALRRFLEVDGDRPLHLRVAATRWLVEQIGDLTGLPLLVGFDIEDWWKVVEAAPAFVPLVVDAALIGGESVVTEKHMVKVLGHARDVAGLAPEAQAALDLRVLEEASGTLARREAASHAVGEELTYGRLRRVAEVFAWGVRRGVELTGRLLRFHLTNRETDFGHTRLDTSRIFVSALPMLRDEPHGQDIVEGLVLHEIGHHVYHRGPAEQALWKRAHQEGIGHLLNLLADEHLERNLRATSPAYGDRLKRLGAYAFQHAPQEIVLAKLLEALRANAARALCSTPLEVAFDEASVRLRRGAVLGELDRAGHPLARFARALRMGLGNRHGDPRIAEALALCKGIRELDMPGLYDLTCRIAELFGGAIELAQCFGGPEGLEFGERDDDVFGAGIDDDILQREVERVLDPRTDAARRDRPSRGERLCINVNAATEFERIHKVERVFGNGEAHRAHALAVSRHAARLRSFLDELGLRWEAERARTSGRALDRTRLRALVTRGDPKILIARRPVRRTDLFLGVLVDCSGSMQAGDNIDRARRFAILVAEAVRTLRGVHARFFGFTDSVIYDAGDAHDCHVVALETDGGNNDAAALFYAGNLAMAAPQRAKVLVMISDGLPTNCSVAALRNLVTELTRRRGIVCAQVAVRKLDEVCFPHHVVLDDHELDVAVAKFGRMIGDLARRVL
jgi:hypothetical protein